MNITPERLARATAALQAVEVAFIARNSETSDNDNTNNNHDNDDDVASSLQKRRFSRRRKRNQCDTTNYALNDGLPSNITKRMELNEWSVSLLFIDHVHPSEQLYTLMNEFFVDPENNQSFNTWQVVVAPEINAILSRLINQSNQDPNSQRTRPDSVTIRCSSDSLSGYVDIDGKLTSSQQFLKAIVAVYYHALEAILYCEAIRQQAFVSRQTTATGNSKNGIISTISATAIISFIRQTSFHRALIACCYVAVSTAVQYTQKIRPSKIIYTMPICSILQNIAKCSSYELIKVSRVFLIPSLSVHSEANKHLGSPVIFTLPRIVVFAIQQVEVNFIDSTIWACNSPLQSVDTWTNQIRLLQEATISTSNSRNIVAGLSCLWPPKALAPILPEEVADNTDTTPCLKNDDEEEDESDNMNEKYSIATSATDQDFMDPRPDHPKYFDYVVVNNIIDTMMSSANHRIMKFCKELRIISRSTSDDEPKMMIPRQMYIVFRYYVRNHIHLFHDRHVDHWILCTLYGVTRSIKYQPELTFAQIISVYISVRERELGPTTCQQIIRHVKVVVDSTKGMNATTTTSSNTQQVMGNIVSLYNRVFVPTFKTYLLSSHSLRICTIKMAQLQHDSSHSTVLCR